MKLGNKDRQLIDFQNGIKNITDLPPTNNQFGAKSLWNKSLSMSSRTDLVDHEELKTSELKMQKGDSMLPSKEDEAKWFDHYSARTPGEE